MSEAPAALAPLPTVDLHGIEVISPGIWNGDEYSDPDLDDLVSDTNELIAKGINIPFLKIGHGAEQHLLNRDEMPADGGVKRLYKRGRKVLADARDVPAELARLVKAGAFPKISAEIWIDGAEFEGRRYRKPLKALSFLGATVPAVSSLNPTSLADVVARYTSYSDERGRVGVTLVDAETPGDARPERGVRAALLAQFPDAADVSIADDGSHAAATGTHSHNHAGHGAADAEGSDEGDLAGLDPQHSHEHTHNGDANHAPGNGHGHSATNAAKDDGVTGANASPPKGYPSDKSQYGDPAHFKYPIDEKHIRAAVSYFNHAGQKSAGGYSTDQWATIGRKIAAAANKLIGDGHSFSNGKIVTDTSNNARAYAADAWSHDEIRMAVQDALQNHFPRVYAADGMPPSGVMADGPSADIEDLYGDGQGDGSTVVVWDQDSDELWQIPFRCDPTSGDCSLGTPARVRVQYEPLTEGSPAEEAADYAAHGGGGGGAGGGGGGRASGAGGIHAETNPRDLPIGSVTPGTSANDEVVAHLDGIGAGIDRFKGRPGVASARALHGMLRKTLTALAGQWPEIDDQGNTDESEGPEGEDASEQDSGGGDIPPHGAPEYARFEEDDEMAETTALARLEESARQNRETQARLAQLERQFNERAEADRARIAELERHEFEVGQAKAVDDAIRAGKLTPAMREVGLRMYASDQDTFHAYVAAAPQVWDTREQGSAGSPDNPNEKPAAALSADELKIAQQMGLDPEHVLATKTDRRSILDKRREYREAHGLPVQQY